MCGICGFVQTHPVADNAESVVVSMRDTMIHRGPDGAGVRIGKQYALGHRRLIIVDLSEKGRQPMCNEDGTVWISFNGEIYNHLDIRPELESSGHVFRSHTDSEVILHGWEEWGIGILDRLNGMFSFCIVDERRGSTLLARDRIGIKPLVYFRTDETIVFASETKALLRHPECPREMRPEVVAEQLMFRHLAGSRTMVRGIDHLEPAHYLLLDNRLKGKPTRYWGVEACRGEGESQTPDTLRSLLDESVRRRMMSDVPLGTQLSGGLDSSLVTRLANDLSPFPLKTYSIGIDIKNYNEQEYSSLVAKDVGTDHCAIGVLADEFDASLDEMVWFMDAPIDHPNSIFLYLLCLRAKQDVTVLLTGEGADELICGYERYAYYRRVMDKYFALPSMLKGAMGLAPQGLSNRKIRMVKQWSKFGPTGMAIRNSRFGSDAMLGMLADTVTLDLGVRESLIERYSDSSAIDALLRLDQQAYLVSILHRQDRVSMGASVEARVPFLDHTLVECVNQIPWTDKLDGENGKMILKRAARGAIPDRIIDRPKMGFPIPLEHWFRKKGGLYPRLSILTDAHSSILDFMDAKGVRRMIDEHTGGSQNHAEDLWILLAFEMWKRRFLDDPSTQNEVSPPEKLLTNGAVSAC